MKNFANIAFCYIKYLSKKFACNFSLYFQDFGEHGGSDLNVVRNCIDKVRKRKGLAVEEKIVVYAEKQRNLNKKKQ